MRILWTIFFLGSMALVALDIRERRVSEPSLSGSPVATDPFGYPTPKPE
jgi:hypothetical protein